MSDSEEDFQIPSSDDEDYVPGAESDESDDEKKVRRSKRSTAQKSMPKRSCRRKGISFAEDSDEERDEEYISEGDEESDEPEVEDDDCDEEENDGNKKKKEEMEKKRIDNLWQSFKSETGSLEKKESDSTSEPAQLKRKPEQIKAPRTVKVTQTYEFAGEEVKVTKEVDADSYEAKKPEDKEEAQNSKADQTAKPTSSTAPKRRLGGGLSSVLGSINKKPKLSTLDKSKLDWEDYKEEEGITDELRTKSSSGYLDKQEFLQRADYRQWENERELRLATSRFKK